MVAVTGSAQGAGDYTMNNDAARRLDGQFDRIYETAQDYIDRNVEQVGATSDLGRMVGLLKDDVSVMNRRYHTSNDDGLSDDAYRVTNGAYGHLADLMDSANKGKMNVSTLQSVISDLDTVLPDGRPPVAAGSRSASSTEAGTLGDLSGVTKDLVDARAADSVGGKIDSLGSAIDKLLAALKGEAPAAGSGGATAEGGTAGRIGEAIGQIAQAGGGTAAGETLAMPQFQTVMTKLDGDALESAVWAGGAALNNDGGVIGVKGGSQRDEIDGSETLTFKAPGGTADGATVEIAKLFSGSSGKDNIQERGVVEIERPDGTVEKMEFYGNGSGNQTIQIEGEFKSLTFRVDNSGEGEGSSNSSDYGIRSIEFGEQVPAGEGAGAPAETRTAPTASIDPAALIELVEALQAFLEKVDNAAMSGADKSAAIDGILRSIEELTSAMGADSEGGQKVTGTELADALVDLQDVVASASGLGEAAGGSLDQIASALETIAIGLETA